MAEAECTLTGWEFLWIRRTDSAVRVGSPAPSEPRSRGVGCRDRGPSPVLTTASGWALQPDEFSGVLLALSAEFAETLDVFGA